MNFTHRYEMRDGIAQIVLYAYTPVEYEFAEEEKSIKTNKIDVTESIKSYVNKHFSSYPNQRVLIILNGVVLGSILVTNLIDNIDSDEKRLLSSNQNSKTDSDKISSYGSLEYIVLEHSDTTTTILSLEEYIIGIVSSEIPINFHIEAIKAQAVAARTYIFYQLSINNKMLINENQKYKTKDELKEIWKDDFEEYYNKIHDAVYSTYHEYLTYNNECIASLYFSSSNGRTENSENIFGTNIPYLESVDSSFEINIDAFSLEKDFYIKDLSTLLELDITSINDFSNIIRNNTNRISSINVKDKTFTGSEIKTLLNLRSTDFDISQSENDIITFTTKGYGHGLGMSQYGANMLANMDKKYDEILRYYYLGTSLNALK